MSLVFRRETVTPDPEQTGISARPYRKDGLIARDRLVPERVEALLAHLHNEHGQDAAIDTAAARITRLRPEQQGAYPFDTHLTSPQVAKFLRLHAQLHHAMGTPLP